MENIMKNVMLMLVLLFAGFNSSVLLAKTIKVATVSPEGTFWMKQMRVGAKEIKERTNGRVKFKFYPGGVMGNDDNVLRKIRIGQLQGGAVTLGVLAQSIPDSTIYGLPFLFSSFFDAEQIRKASDPLLSKKIDDKGFVNFGIAQGGFSYLMSKDKISSFDDLRKQKSWIPEKSDVGLSVYRNVGVAPISLPLSDVLTGLQTGLINTVAISPIGVLALQWHTHIHYVVDLPLNYVSAVLIIDKKTFNKLSAEDQSVVREVMTKAYKKIDQQNKIENTAARQALVNLGVKFVKLSDSEKMQWLKTGDLVIEEMINKYAYDKDIYKSVMAHKSDAPKLH